MQYIKSTVWFKNRSYLINIIWSQFVIDFPNFEITLALFLVPFYI